MCEKACAVGASSSSHGLVGSAERSESGEKVKEEPFSRVSSENNFTAAPKREGEVGGSLAGRCPPRKGNALPKAGRKPPRKRYTGVWMSQRRPVTEVEIRKAHQAASSFKSKNPFLVQVMRKFDVYFGHMMFLEDERYEWKMDKFDETTFSGTSFPLNDSFPFQPASPHSSFLATDLKVPRAFSRQCPPGKQTMIFWDPMGKPWRVNYIDCNGKCFFSGGWRKFALANFLEQDDACVFELIGSNEIRVHIFRVVEEIRPLIRKVGF